MQSKAHFAKLFGKDGNFTLLDEEELEQLPSASLNKLVETKTLEDDLTLNDAPATKRRKEAVRSSTLRHDRACAYCARMYFVGTPRNSYYEHTRTCKLNPNRRVFYCSTCDITLYSAGGLRKHFRSMNHKLNSLHEFNNES